MRRIKINFRPFSNDTSRINILVAYLEKISRVKYKYVIHNAKSPIMLLVAAKILLNLAKN